jgi:hypothetical protein
VSFVKIGAVNSILLLRAKCNYIYTLLKYIYIFFFIHAVHYLQSFAVFCIDERIQIQTFKKRNFSKERENNMTIFDLVLNE